MIRTVIRKKSLILFTLLMVAYFTMTALAAGGPGSGSNTASVIGTGDYSTNSYSFAYSYDSTYHGALSSERPNTTTDGAAASVAFSGNCFTFSATSSAGVNKLGSSRDKSAQNVSTEATITNNSGKTLTIGYTYSVDGGIITGSDLTTGSGTLTWLPGQTIGFMVKTTVTNWAAASSTATATFTITSCTEVSNYDLSIYPTQFGSYSYSVGADPVTLAPGAAAYTGAASESTMLKCTVPVLSATYQNDYVFYGWSVNGVVTASSADYEAAVTTHTMIFPVIVKKDIVNSDGHGPFYVNGNYYVFWKEAFEAAGTSYTVVMARDYTLPTTLEENGLIVADGKFISGVDGNLSYHVPTNAKLLIPYSGDFVESFQSRPTNIFLSLSEGVTLFDTGGITKRNSTYVTLTVPKGVKIDCYGSINVNGQRQKDGQPYSGVSLGGHGKITLGQETANFTERNEEAIEKQLILYNGSTLYCYGYITGTGMVDAQNGSKVHEFIQLCDWPGGSNAFNWNNATKTSFLLTQYYVQNIEAPLKANYGAVCYIETVTTQSNEQKTASSAYINTQDGGTGMFLLNENAYVLRIYDHTNDRMQYHLKGGTVDFGNISVTFKYLWDVTISSKDYILALNNHISVYVESGTTLNVGNKISILPGAEVITREGSKVNLTNQLYIWDVNDWKESYMFSRAYDDDSYYNTGYTMTNKSPNNNSLPYVATLNNVSPRTKGLVRLKDGTGETYFMDAINYIDSGRLEINGTLNISGSGSLCTTSGTAIDKNIKGTGTITIASTPVGGSMSVGHSGTITSISTVAGQGNLAGVGTLKSFESGTYYGLGDVHNNFWYQTKNEIEPNCTEGGRISYTCTGATSSYDVHTSEALGHAWDNDCDTDCNNGCGYTRIVIHSYDLVVTAPSCTEQGYTTYTCSCGDTYVSDVIPATGHTWQDWIITVEPSCSAEGERVQNCVNCDASNTASINQLKAVAQVGEDKYPSLKAALASVENGGTILLLDQPEEIKIAQNVTIDLNGLEYTIQTASGWNAVVNGNAITVSKQNGLFDIYATSITVADSLDLYFYVKTYDLTNGITDAYGNANYCAKVTRTTAGGSTETTTIQSTEWNPDSVSSTEGDIDCYRFCFSDIAAKEMTDEISVIIYKNNSDITATQVSTEYIETIEDYALRTLKHNSGDTEKEKALRKALVDLLNYGAGCQDYFGYHTNEMANENLGTFSGQGTLLDPACESKLSYEGNLVATSVSAKNRLMYTFYFDKASITNATQAIVTVGGTSSTVARDEFFKYGENWLGIDVTGISLIDGRTTITCTVQGKNASGEEIVLASGADTIEGYVARVKNAGITHEVFGKLMRFSDSALAYSKY